MVPPHLHRECHRHYFVFFCFLSIIEVSPEVLVERHDMFHSRNALSIVSSVMITFGVGTTGYGAFAIIEMNSTSTADHIPLLVPLESSQESLAKEKLAEGDVIGSLSIPRLNEVLPIVEGTGTKELDRGFGHYVDSVLPGFSDNSVLTGHSDLALKNLGKLRVGDRLTARTDRGVFIFEVQRFRVVQADDNSAILRTKEAALTLSTSFPFDHIGNAPMRFIVQAGLVVGTPID